MSPSNTYLAVFTGSSTGARRAAWDALSEQERLNRQQAGVAAWKAWVVEHQSAIVAMGGPLGKTKRVGPEGISDIRNALAAFTVVQAESHEAAARMFEGHPHFAIFPGDAIEVMPVLPVPAG